VFLVNHLPGTDDFSGAFSDRIKIVKFDRVFRGAADEIKGLKDQLKVEYPGILNWALEGLGMWQEEGQLITPSSVEGNVTAYMAESNPVARWLADIPQGANYQMTYQDAFGAYKQWAERNDELCKSDQWFSKRMAQLGHRSESTNIDGKTTRTYQGFRVRVTGVTAQTLFV